MLIEQRRRTHRVHTPAVEPHWRPHRQRRCMRILDGHHDAEVLDLGVAHGIVDAVDRRMWHVLGLQTLQVNREQGTPSAN